MEYENEEEYMDAWEDAETEHEKKIAKIELEDEQCEPDPKGMD